MFGFHRYSAVIGFTYPAVGKVIRVSITPLACVGLDVNDEAA